jgi:EAL domain-containing protein (putative c-di-GMP-specific phosphodiesterase class I)/GGDEF domain-containing protein
MGQSALALRRGFVQVGAALRRPEVLVLLPAALLVAYLLGGEQALIVTALGLPLILGLILALSLHLSDPAPATALPAGGLVTSPQIVTALDSTLSMARVTGHTTACLALRLDEVDRLTTQFGKPAAEMIAKECITRVMAVLRQTDCVAPTGDGGLVVALGPVRQLGMETLVQLASRLQGAVSPPITLGSTQVYVTCSVGFCLGGRADDPSGQALYDAAMAAAEAAWHGGPGAIRSYAPEMGKSRSERSAERAALEAALDQGQFRAFFQPQVSTGTGEVSGFEALARWQNPERGMVPPSVFLPAIEAAGLMEKLGTVILNDALQAISRWDKAGHAVPRVSVNFAAEELRSPQLPDRIKWALEKFDLEPGRLTVEILETVVTQTENDMVVRNIAALSAMGCGIDLDDFGTGHTSLGTIRRFALRRLKVDRSFVTRVNEDPDQRRICAAILSLAERLGLETIAEGVETSGEHAMLAQLGFTHTQGFGIGRPMPFEETVEWMARHQARLAGLPRLNQAAQ